MRKIYEIESVPYATYAINDEFNEEYYYGIFERIYNDLKNSPLYVQRVYVTEFNRFDVDYNSINPK